MPKKENKKKEHPSYRNHSGIKMPIEGFCQKMLSLKNFLIFEALRQQRDKLDGSEMTFSFKNFRALFFALIMC